MHACLCRAHIHPVELCLGAEVLRYGCALLSDHLPRGLSFRSVYAGARLVPHAPPFPPHQALEYARAALGFDPRHTLAAGDSGNDIDMLEGGHLSVVVGNAQPDLKAWVQQRLSQQQGISGKPGDLEGASPGEGEGRGYHSYVSGEGARAGGVLAEGEGEGMVPPSGRVGTLYMAERDRAWGILEALQQFGFKE